MNSFRILLICAAGCLAGCGEKNGVKPGPAPAPVDTARMERGHALAKQHCTACHLEPDPAVLPRDRWSFAVDWMGHYLGHDVFTGKERNIVMTELLPPGPKLSAEELADITYYFVESAGDELRPAEVFTQPLLVSERFRPEPWGDMPQGLLISCLQYDAGRQRMFVASGSEQMLYECNLQGKPLSGHRTGETQAVGVTVNKGGFMATLIGDLFSRKDFGSIMVATREAAGYRYTFPVSNFYRIAHCAAADLNGDGIDDYAVSGFGAAGGGAFSLFASKAGGGYQRKDLLSRMGPLGTVLDDVDGDGDLDIHLLTAQGAHDLILYRNQGGLEFTEELQWRQQPSFGSTSMHQADLDGDGRGELIVTTGNNLELPKPPVRPYHGLYVFRQGDRSGKPVFFQPLPGAVASRSADFDGDGRLDIVVVSNLPDWRVDAPEAVVLLMNKGNFTFEASLLAQTRGTQWLSVECCDLDGDGDQDILLGAIAITPVIAQENFARFERAIARQPSVLAFINQGK